MKLLDPWVDAFLARFGNPTRVLKEQLDAQGVVTTEITVEWALIKPRAS